MLMRSNHTQGTYFNSLRHHLEKVHLTVPPKDKMCEYCSYTTAYPSALTKHVKAIHLKEERFKCNLCDFTAVWSVVLRDHKKNVHCKASQEQSEVT